jgi:hypothetical protein
MYLSLLVDGKRRDFKRQFRLSPPSMIASGSLSGERFCFSWRRLETCSRTHLSANRMNNWNWVFICIGNQLFILLTGRWVQLKVPKRQLKQNRWPLTDPEAISTRREVAVINLFKKWVLPVIDVNVSKYPAIISSLSSVLFKRVTDRLRNWQCKLIPLAASQISNLLR